MLKNYFARPLLLVLVALLFAGYSVLFSGSAQAAGGAEAVAGSAATTAGANVIYRNEDGTATKASAVLVQKSRRRLRLLKGGLTLREYRISLGKEPVGPKRYQGDKKTPEGRYTLDWRNPKSKFYRSLHVSYPNARDRANAKKLGRSPGGDIMIHGIPNEFHYAPWLYTGKDWTDGCISVTNTEMDEIWELVDDGTPIVILP